MEFWWHAFGSGKQKVLEIFFNFIGFMTFQVLIAASMKFRVFWDVGP
jgi:hypothetical protein